MAGNYQRKTRWYKELPVCVVEDHNDVLPHIYRAIASRHLPFQGMTMLHFDSHPDLQIATEMDADTVFDKFELLSSLSIENWILPAVYAGHFKHVVWVKPPWADQLPEGRKQVLVGRHCQSKKLRISWPDSYFLSDLLYAAEEDLEGARELTVDVVTLNATDTAASDHRGPCEHSGENTVPNTSVPEQPSSRHKAPTPPLTRTEEERSGQETHSSEHCQSSEEKTMAPLDDTDSASREERPGSCGRAEGAGMKEQGAGIKEPHGPLQPTLGAAVQSGTATVLDIDLDFFSTRNPFKEIYPETLFRRLEDLYSFEGPVDGSARALADCMRTRGTQLQELETALRLAVSGQERTDQVTQDRFRKVAELVQALRRLHGDGKGEEPDAEMIHMAGLTCDDTGELPHHVSTQEEIDELVAAVETHLSQLPKPVMVTVARSSHDDYCPPEQVDLIQLKVLKMLQNVYGKLDVHLDYGNQTDALETT